MASKKELFTLDDILKANRNLIRKGVDFNSSRDSKLNFSEEQLNKAWQVAIKSV